MATIRVNSATLRSKANQLQQMNAQFKSKVSQLANYEQSLAGMWEGEARNAFHTAFNNDRAQFDTFYEGINKYIQALLDAAQKYEQAEAANLGIARRRDA